jgi:hypothetical protein
VDEARPEALEELALTEDDRRLGPDAAPDLACAVRRPSEPDDPVQEVRAAEEQSARDDERPGE